jgi:hypothetical protein
MPGMHSFMQLQFFFIGECFLHTARVTRCRRDDQGCTPLHMAAARNRGELVDALLKSGAGSMRVCVLTPVSEFV